MFKKLLKLWKYLIAFAILVLIIEASLAAFCYYEGFKQGVESIGVIK